MIRQRPGTALNRLFAIQSVPPASPDWPSRAWGALGILVGLFSMIEMMPRFSAGQIAPQVALAFAIRAAILVYTGVWVMLSNPWRAVNAAEHSLSRMMLMISAAILVPSSVASLLEKNGLEWFWFYIGLVLSVLQCFWLARRGLGRMAALLLTSMLVTELLGLNALFSAFGQTSGFLVYGVIVVVAGLTVRWWVAILLAVGLPLTFNGLATLGFSGLPMDWKATLVQILILCTQGGMAGLYSHTLETTLSTTGERAEALQKSQTALERSENHLKNVISYNPVILFIIDRQGIFTMVEGKEFQQMNLDPASFVGRSALKIFKYTPDGINLVQKALSGQPAHGQVEVRSSIFDVFISPVTDEQGEIREFIGIATNISERMEAETALRRSEQNYRSIFNTTSEAIFIHDPETGSVLDVNQSMLEMFGCTYEEALQFENGQFNQGEGAYTWESAFDKIRQAVEVGPQIFQWRSRRSNGELFWSEISLRSVVIGGEPRVLAVVRDTSERKRMEEALYEEKERAMVTLHSIGDAVITTDATSRVEYLNPVAENLTGWSLNEACGKNLSEVFHIVDEQSRLPARDPIQRCLQEGRIVGLANHTVLISRDGQEHDIDDSAAPIHSRDGQLLGAVLVFHDVTETRRIARQMAFDASHDLLTGLINRREFENRLERALLSAKEFGEQHVLCYLDLDQFKIINDTAGHAVGDQMLKEVTQLLSGLFRRNDTLSRLGGDEFGLLLMNCPMEKAAAIAANVIDQLNQYRFHWQGRHFQIGVSIGAVAINAGSESIAKVLSQADVACYTAKDLGRGRVHIFHPADAETIQRHSELVLAVRLREAIEREQFVLYCQPIIPLLNNTTDRQAHYELLLRMVDEEGRLVPPATFIGPAERYDLMGTIDRWVIQAAFRLYSRRFNGDGPNFAINLSGNSLNDDSLLDYVLAKMQEFKIPPEKLCFEITETAAIHNLNKAQHFAHEIRRQGVRIALDDFGSGLSSFRYLKVLPVDYLKIDGSFVREMLDSVTDMAMVSAINQVGHSLGIQTIAEHVTSLQIADCVRNLGVDYAQGFGLGHPMPVEEAWKFDG